VRRFERLEALHLITAQPGCPQRGIPVIEGQLAADQASIDVLERCVGILDWDLA
jgi:hypothetical protein